MNFFFHTPAGAIDVAVMVAICLPAVVWGKRWARIGALAVLAVYLAERVIMAAVGINPYLGGAVEFVAVLLCVFAIGGRVGNALAALFFVKLVVYIAVAAGQLSLAAMATGATVAAYLQLLILAAGVPWRGIGGYVRNRLSPGPRLRGGRRAVESRSALD